MSPAATREEILAAMEKDVGEAMRRHIPAFFAAGVPNPRFFLGHMAKPLIATLYGLGVESLRDEQGGTLPPDELDGLVKSAITTAFITKPATPEPTR
jgi:hypothetical protein